MHVRTAWNLWAYCLAALSIGWTFTPAAASEAWHGYWAEQPINCAKGHIDTEGGVGPLIISQNQVEDFELYCDVIRAEKNKSKFTLRLNCSSEGMEYPALLAGEVKGSKMKVSLSGEICKWWGPCKPRVLQKCKK